MEWPEGRWQYMAYTTSSKGRETAVLAAGCWLLAAGCWLLAAGCWLLAAGCWLLAAGHWALGTGPAGCWGN